MANMKCVLSMNKKNEVAPHSWIDKTEIMGEAMAPTAK